MNTSTSSFSIAAPRLALLICTILIVAFGALSYSAALRKSATADEPLHALGGYLRTFHADYRLNPEDPTLFTYLAMVPHSRSSIVFDPNSEEFAEIATYMWRSWRFCVKTLYRTPENNPDTFIQRSRFMMMLLAVTLAILLAWWAWRLGGPLCAVIATALLAFDPNFLGHGSLVKNDVPITMCFVATMMALWNAGRRVTVVSAMTFAIALAISVNMKFSGLVLVPISIVTLLSRAILPQPWIALGRTCTQRASRVLVAILVLLLAAIVCYGSIWACYRFRYSVAPDESVKLNMALITRAAKQNKLIIENRGFMPTDEQIDEARPPAFANLLNWVDEHRLLPQAYTGGLLNTYATTLVRSNYIFGSIGVIGRWYYFPVAIAVKTPIGTLLLIGLAAGLWFWLRRRGPGATDRWGTLCVAIPLALYGWNIVTSGTNLGLRHAYPLYPFLFIFAGLTLARWIAQAPPAASSKARTARLAATAFLIAITAIESLVVYPHFMAFFNQLAGGMRNGPHILGDSNIDWGQDLLELKRWQSANPDEKLHLAYFGMIDPGYYLRYTPVPGNMGGRGESVWPPPAGAVVAISVTHLQGIYLEQEGLREMYRFLLNEVRPREVLGGSIYLYDWPPRR